MSVGVLGFLETLSEIIGTVFGALIGILVLIIQKFIWPLFYKLFMSLFSQLIMQGVIIMLRGLDFLVNVFDVFAGIKQITYTTYTAGVGNTPQNMTLIDMFMGFGVVKTAFMYITAIAVVVCFGITLFSVIKNMGDGILEGKGNVMDALKRALKAAFTLLLIPAMMWLLLNMSAVMLTQTSFAMDKSMEINIAGVKPNISRIVWLIGTADMKGKPATDSMSKPDNNNIRFRYYSDYRDGNVYYSYQKTGHGSTAFFEPKPTGKTDCRDILGREDSLELIKQMKKDFESKSGEEDGLFRYNFVTVIVVGVALILIMIATLVTFIGRIFDVLLLYLVSPFFVSMMPMDEGAMFNKWRDMFVAKMFQAFGPVIGMKLFIMMLPVLMDPNLVLNVGSGLPEDFQRFADVMARTFLIIGGCWSMYQSRTLIISLLSYEAAETADAGASALMGHMSKKVMSGVNRASSAIASGGASEGIGAPNKPGSGGGKGGDGGASKAESNKFIMDQQSKK